MNKIILSLALLTACGQTDECRRLAELQKAWDKTRVTAEERAANLPRVKERAAKLEDASRKLMDDTWLEADDQRVHAELLKRVSAIPTGTVAKSQAMLGSTDEGDSITTTEFMITFEEKDLAKAWDKVVAIGQVPPLLTLSAVIKAEKGAAWGVRMQRFVQGNFRSPFKPGRVPLDKPDDPSTVPTQMGFCGAGDLRQKIVAIQSKIGSVEADADQATILMASGPTAEGVRRRAEKALKTERESREIMTRVIDGIAKQKLPFKAIGFEDPAIVVELWGGPKELKALETLLLPFGDRVKPTELAAPGVVRRQIMVTNTAKKEVHEE